MGRMTTRHRKEFHQRRSDRYAEVGRKFEQEEMRRILEKAQERGVFTSFAIFDPNSEEDRDGKDIRIDRVVNGEVVTRYCGVTISLRCMQNAQLRHPNVPQFCFPIGTKPETIEKRLRSLFQ